MEGFVRNETGKAVFKAQRPLPPGAKLYFEDAYLVFENKSGKKKGASFVKWLRENVFPEEGWAFYKDEGVPFFAEKKTKSATSEKKTGPVDPVPESDAPKQKVAPAKGAGRKLVKKSKKVSRNNNTAAAIIEAELPQAKSLIGQTKDRQVLKKALSLSNHFANKEEHRRLIQRRLEEVY